MALRTSKHQSNATVIQRVERTSIYKRRHTSTSEVQHLNMIPLPTRRYRPIKSASISIALAACALLSACDSSNQDATPSHLQASAQQKTSALRQAANDQDSRVCVVNDSSVMLSVTFIQEDDSERTHLVKPNSGTAGQSCETGRSTSSTDVYGSIVSTTPKSAVGFQAWNTPKLGQALFGYSDTDEQSYACLLLKKSSVGDTATWDNGVLTYTATREPGSAALNQWRIDVTPTSNPATDGKARHECSA